MYLVISPRLLIFFTLDSIQLMIRSTIAIELPVMIMSSTHSRTMTLSLVSSSKSVKTHISCMQLFIPVYSDVSIFFICIFLRVAKNNVQLGFSGVNTHCGQYKKTILSPRTIGRSDV